MAITRFYKIVQPEHDAVASTDNQDISGSNGLYGNYTWYHRLIQGSATRLVKYREYDVMDDDIDVARSLDIIAEEMTGNNPKSKEPLLIKLANPSEQKVKSTTLITLNAALKTWCKIQQWDKRIFELSRNLVKYGDCFFLKPKDATKKLTFVHPKNVVSAAVAEDDVTDVKGWFIKNDYLRANQGWSGGGDNSIGSGAVNDHNVQQYGANEVVRYSLNDDMSMEAPFGVSILRPVYKTFKQKELLEDAVLIYRIQRAPERRVFYIDVGRMPAQKVAGHLEQIKNEIKQKKIPTQYGGKATVDSTYNPQSMSEDFFLAQRPDGSGSRIETLPGGNGLGELSDLEYFYKKMWRAMRIPNSYMSNMPEDGAVNNEGRVGIAYMQEIKFTLYIQRLQTYIERVMDEEFKLFLYDSNIRVDPTIFDVILPEPSDYSKSRDQAMNSDMLNTYSSADGIEVLSKRFSLINYLGLTPSQMKENEYLKAEELGLDPNDEKMNLPQIYSPETAEAGGFEGGLGGSSGGSGGLGGGEGGLGGLDDSEGGEAGEGGDVDGDGTDTAPINPDAKPDNTPKPDQKANPKL